MSQKLKLVRRILTLSVLVVITLLIFRWCSKKKDSTDFTIENTPIKVEMIRNIAEIATLSYKDEVVVDSVEYYQSTSEQIAGNLSKLTDPDDFKYGIRSSAIRRRITLLVRGEIRFGFDLTKHPVRIEETDSLIKVFLPEPSIVDIQVTPSTTEVFLENGDWKDYEIRRMHNKARQKLISNAETLELSGKIKSGISGILGQLIRKNKPFVVLFEN